MKKKPFPKTLEECMKQNCMKCGFLKEDEDGFECTEKEIGIVQQIKVDIQHST